MEPVQPTLEESSNLQALAANLETILIDLVEKAFAKMQTLRTATTFGTDNERVTQDLRNSTREEIAQLASGSPENMPAPVGQRIGDIVKREPSFHTEVSGPSIERFGKTPKLGTWGH